MIELGVRRFTVIALCLAACGPAPQRTTVPAPPVAATPVPFQAKEPQFGPRPAAPWPPPAWDEKHWVGPGTGRGRLFRLPKGGTVASAGCPFEAVELPPCPDGIEASAPEGLADRTDLENQVVTIAALMRAQPRHSWSWNYLSENERRAGNVPVRVIGVVLLGEALAMYDVDPWCERAPCSPADPRFVCYGDETAECCGVPSDRRVVARGRLQSSFGEFLYAPLICDLGNRRVRLVDLPSRSAFP